MIKRTIILLLVLFTITSIFSENKYALIIGNGNYSSAPLKNPVNDATDFSNALEKIGFDVTIITDGSKRDIKEGIKSFKSSLSNGGTALFYYSGHGIQVDEKNYIIPVGADLVSEDDVEYEAVEMDYILTSLENSGSNKNIIIFDACRNNNLQRSSKSATKGLVVTKRKISESIIIYATSPGEVAYDGDGRNSPFVESFIKNMNKPTIGITTLMFDVNRDVKKLTDDKQSPWTSANLTEEIFLAKNKFNNSIDNKVTSKKPSLFVLSIGLNNYNNSGFNLKYASRDAKKIAKIFESQNNTTLYSKVEVKTILDKNATKNGIKDGIHSFLSKANPKDMVILFFAGMSTMEKDGKDYLVGYNADIKNISTTCISFSEIEDAFLFSVQAKNILLIFDTNISQGSKIFNTITAVSKNEFALEKSEWDGGAFTSSLFSCFIHGQADNNDDGYIDIKEMYKYVNDKVVSITNNKQHPEIYYGKNHDIKFYQVQ